VRKAYRVAGSSFTKPENLPEGLTVKERLVGEVLGTSSLVFHEVKDGSVVVYRQGVPNSNAKLSYEEVRKVMIFLNRVVNAHLIQVNTSMIGNVSKCPGTPHRGHASSDWSCPLDRS
jgi:hypothetical protein